MTGLLGLSVALNVALGAFVFQKTHATRTYYWRQWTASPAPSAAPTPRPVLLATPPPLDREYSHRRLERTPQRFGYRDEAGVPFTRWHRRAKEALIQTLGYQPRPFSGEVVHTEHSEYPTFTRDKVYLKAPEGLWIPAVLLLPKGERRPRPAVLALPGHDWGKFAGIRSITGDDVPDNYMAAFGLRLAEAGYVVLAVDVPGIGELAGLDYFQLAKEGLLIGEPLKTLMLEATHLAVDYMESRPEIDPAHMGTMGVSLGGELAGYSAALDSRLDFAIVSGFLSSYRDIGHGSTDALYVPGILRVLEIPDIIGLIAPRPVLLQMGRKDHNFEFPRFQVHVDAVRRIYRGAGAEHALAVDVHEGGHAIAPASAIAWLKTVAPVNHAP